MSDLFQTHAVVREVGLRDGLQSLQRVMPTEFKQQWIQRAYEAGMREIEVASFVPPQIVAADGRCRRGGGLCLQPA